MIRLCFVISMLITVAAMAEPATDSVSTLAKAVLANRELAPH